MMIYHGDELNSRKDSVTLACRFDGTLYELLKNDSSSKGISLNSLISSILKRYVSWERYAEEIGFVPLAKESVRVIFDNLEEENIKEIANQVGRSITKELILLIYNRIDFNSIISFLETCCSRYGTVLHKNSGSYHDFILYHSVNKKFTDFLCNTINVMAEELSFRFEVINADSKILSIRIRENSIV